MNDAPFLVGLSGKKNNPRPILADKKFELDLSVSGNIFHIDGGNYHYLSLFTTNLIMEDFALVLFDNHTDTQLPSFGGILSCGSWAREAFITNPHLKKLIIIGPDDEAIASLTELSYPVKEIVAVRRSDYVLFDGIDVDWPIYFSIDLDVLSKDYLDTNWDQGIMSPEMLKDLLAKIACSKRVCGLDICGEGF